MSASIPCPFEPLDNRGPLVAVSDRAIVDGIECVVPIPAHLRPIPVELAALRPLDHPDVLREAQTVVRWPRRAEVLPEECSDARTFALHTDAKILANAEPRVLVKMLHKAEARADRLERENAALRSERDALVKAQRDWRTA